MSAPASTPHQPWLRLLWCLVGAALGLGLTLAVVGDGRSPFLLASLGGTTVFLFGLTQAPAAQPRSLIGGHLGGALIGVACGRLLGDTLPVYVLAQVLTLGWMLLARCTHPPAGANPLIMIHEHADWSALWDPVGLGVLVLVGVAAVWSRLARGTVRYPVALLEPSPPSVLWGAWALPAPSAQPPAALPDAAGPDPHTPPREP